MKIVKYIAVTLASLSVSVTVFSYTASARSFTDVFETHTNFNAIEYLKAVNVLNGYPDQSFKPGNQVNRAEFLKIVLEGSGIAANETTPVPFPDVDNDAWYAPYIRTAFARGWIEGYPDGTFKPESPINKVEALKITGLVQEWQLQGNETLQIPFNDTPRLAWFTPYVAFAKERNLLEESTDYFGPSISMSRAAISEVLFRTHITFTNNEEIYDASFIDTYAPEVAAIDNTIDAIVPDPVIPDPDSYDFVPADFQLASSNFFDDATLNENFPNTFYQNEVYYIEGTANSSVYDRAFVFLAPDDSADGTDYLNFIADIDSKTFSIPVFFREPGNYRMGLIMGNSGESKVVRISVLPGLPAAASATPSNQNISSFNVHYVDQNTTFSWSGGRDTLKRLTIYQGNQTRTFLLRQDKSSFSVDYADFDEFTEGTVYATIDVANRSSVAPLILTSDQSTPAELSFQATKHLPSEIVENSISYDTLPERFTSIQDIKINGTAQADIFREAAIIRPSGQVELIDMTSTKPYGDYFGSDIIENGSDYSFSYTPETDGTYMIELNGTDGSAIINTPVYINNGIPLLPHFFDLTSLDPDLDIDIEAAKTSMLDLINLERTKVGLQPVIMDADLSDLALAQSHDMIDRNFFNHVNPDGLTPDDRRKEAGIPTPVGENLAVAPTVMYTHQGLMLSAIHRNNILNPNWTRVGIGIVQKSNGSLVTTQEFSTFPLTEAQIDEMRTRMIDALNQKRIDINLPSFTIHSDLNDVAEEWSALMGEMDFFDFISPNGESLSAKVNGLNTGQSVQAIIVEGTSEAKVIEKLLEITEVEQETWQRIGFGLDVDSVGILKCTILFTTH